MAARNVAHEEAGGVPGAGGGVGHPGGEEVRRHLGDVPAQGARFAGDEGAVVVVLSVVVGQVHALLLGGGDRDVGGRLEGGLLGGAGHREHHDPAQAARDLPGGVGHLVLDGAGPGDAAQHAGGRVVAVLLVVLGDVLGAAPVQLRGALQRTAVDDVGDDAVLHRVVQRLGPGEERHQVGGVEVAVVVGVRVQHRDVVGVLHRLPHGAQHGRGRVRGLRREDGVGEAGHVVVGPPGGVPGQERGGDRGAQPDAGVGDPAQGLRGQRVRGEPRTSYGRGHLLQRAAHPRDLAEVLGDGLVGQDGRQVLGGHHVRAHEHPEDRDRATRPEIDRVQLRGVH